MYCRPSSLSSTIKPWCEISALNGECVQCFHLINYCFILGQAVGYLFDEPDTHTQFTLDCFQNSQNTLDNNVRNKNYGIVCVKYVCIEWHFSAMLLPAVISPKIPFYNALTPFSKYRQLTRSPLSIHSNWCVLDFTRCPKWMYWCQINSASCISTNVINKSLKVLNWPVTVTG